MSSNLPPGCGALPTEQEDWREAYFDELMDAADRHCSTPGHYEALIAALPGIIAACDANEKWLRQAAEDALADT